jgi:hypothetical protein
MNEETKFVFEDKNYKIIRPTNKIRKESDSIYAKAYRKAIADGLFLEAEIDNIIKARGIKAFNDSEKSNLEKLISSIELKFTSNSFSTIDEGMEQYEKIVKLRKDIEELDKAKRELSSQSASLYAENERFNFLVFSCSREEDDSLIWDDFEDYKEDTSELAIKFSSEMLSVVYDGAKNLMEEINRVRPENIWLEKSNQTNKEPNSEPKRVKKKSKENKS